MVAKIPFRTVYTGAAATGLAEFQAGEFLDYPVGGTGQTTLGTANQILATNAGATGIGTTMYQLDVDSISFPSLNVTQAMDV